MRIFSILFHQFPVRPLFGHSALIKYKDSSGNAGRTYAVRHDKGSFLSGNPGKHMVQAAFLQGIHARGRLVQGNEIMIPVQPPCDRHALPLPAGQFGPAEFLSQHGIKAVSTEGRV